MEESDGIYELDLAIARACGRVDGLREARDIVGAIPLSKQPVVHATAVLFERLDSSPATERPAPKAEPVHEQPQPAPAPSKPRLVIKQSERIAVVSQILFVEGPKRISELVRRLDMSDYILRNVVANHKWFDLALGGTVSLTTEGHQAAKERSECTTT